MADRLQDVLAKAIKDGKIPHAVVAATNKDGSFQFLHGAAADQHALFMLASQTKLLTVVAVLPELARQKIMIGFGEDDKPILKDRTKTMTQDLACGGVSRRHLLTHTSGANYPFARHMQKYRTLVGRDSVAFTLAPTIVERYDHPLQFEPGEGWMYSPGLDWAGLLVERVMGMSLEEYEKTNLWDPLGVDGITFWPSTNAELKNSIPTLVKRGSDGKFVPSTDPHLNTFSTDCFGGHGAFARLGDYLKVQRSLLANDGVLLKPESVDELFRPQLETGPREGLNRALRAMPHMLMNELNTDIELDHALGGLVFTQDDVGRRKGGTMSWGGFFNLWWSIDREAGIAMSFGVQVLPPGDPGCREMAKTVERAVYEMAGVPFS